MLADKKKRKFFDKLNEIYTPPKRQARDSRENQVTTSPVEKTIDPKTAKIPELPAKSETIYLVPIGKDISRKRLEIWKTRLHEMDIVVEEKYRSDVGTIVASTTLSRSKLMEICPNADLDRVVTPDWIIRLIQTKERPSQCKWFSEEDAMQELVKPPAPPTEAPPAKSKPDTIESSLDEQTMESPAPILVPELNGEDELEARKELFYSNNPGMRAVHAEENASNRKFKTDSFVCMTSSVLKKNLNEHLTGPMEELIAYLSVEKDEWRENSYKALSILKQLPERVTDVSQLKPQHGLNKNGIGKIEEILETGTLRKLEAKKSDARLQVLRKFSDIWGVGPSTATDLYSAGFRNLDDLRAKQDEVLNEKQKIGLKHYDDFLVKIPRQEVEEIERLVKKYVHLRLPRAVAITCGSYRRGKSQSGDVDILITDPSVDDCNILPKLLVDLHEIGFLTDDLTTVLEHHIGGCDSYMGVCRLKEGMRYRRIDIKVYPRNLFGFAILYFTGSDHFNRSMRAFAKMKGYSLTDKALYKAARTKGVKKLKKGENLICPDEKDVFIALQLPYKRPEERNCMA